MLIQILGLSKTTPAKDLFSRVNFGLNKGDRIALVGENGTGKTTILKIILGLEDPDEGQVVKSGDITINWQPQDPTDDFVLQKMEEINSSNARQEAGFVEIINGLKLWEVLEKSIGSLSGGERTKIVLAAALIFPANLVILDEPTNYLDLESLAWLEKYLDRKQPTLLFVSHDREFLDKISNQILLLENGLIKNYAGNYTEFCQKREKETEATMTTYRLQQKTKEQLLSQVETVKNQALKTENSTHNDVMRRYAKKVAKKAKVMENRVEKMISRDDWVSEIRETPKIHLEFESRLESGQTLLSAKNLSFGYGEDSLLLKDIDFRLVQGEKVAILGANGSGKTTLLRIFDQELAPQAGQIWRNDQALFSYFSQRLIDILSTETVLAAAKGDTSCSDSYARNILGMLLITKDKVFEPVENLSLGEKTRLGLAKVLISSPDVLILDEFSAHLDLESLEKVEEAINYFKGAVLLVTHDRYMLRNLNLDKIYLLEGGKLKEMYGNLDNYLTD